MVSSTVLSVIMKSLVMWKWIELETLAILLVGSASKISRHPSIICRSQSMSTVTGLMHANMQMRSMTTAVVSSLLTRDELTVCSSSDWHEAGTVRWPSTVHWRGGGAGGCTKCNVQWSVCQSMCCCIMVSGHYHWRTQPDTLDCVAVIMLLLLLLFIWTSSVSEIWLTAANVILIQYMTASFSANICVFVCFSPLFIRVKLEVVTVWP